MLRWPSSGVASSGGVFSVDVVHAPTLTVDPALVIGLVCSSAPALPGFDDERAEELRAAITMAPQPLCGRHQGAGLRVRRSLCLPSLSFAGKDVVRQMHAARDDRRLEWSDALGEHATWLPL